MPTLIDAPRAYPASNAYRITHVPSLFLVETDGKISQAIEGFSKADHRETGRPFRRRAIPRTENSSCAPPG